MPWLKRILAAVDVSPKTEAVLEYAAFLAELYGAELEVVHVLQQRPGDTGAGRVRQADRLDAESDFFRLVYRGHELRKTLDAMPYHSARRAALSVEVGDPATIIKQELDSGGHDLVLVGRPTGAGPGVGASIRNDAPCGVMIVRDDVRIPFSPRQEGASGPVMRQPPGPLGMARAPWKDLDAIGAVAS